MALLTGEISLADDMVAAMRTAKLRTLTEFAEQEIVVPDGPYPGRLKLRRHPAGRLLYQELESGRWRRAFITGPNQDGKSLLGFIVPTLYLLFERRESVILGVPSLDMVADKWQVNLLPAIKRSRYADQLPTSGGGSRGGESVLFEFRNGASLRFMTGGGGDQSRAGFTAPNLVVTETEGFDVVGGSSREGDKFSQLERRSLAFADRARILAECTVSNEQGRTWREIKAGTDSRIALPCPHCGGWVTPEREHFRGWDRDDDRAAAACAHLCCPDCGAEWTNEQRLWANERAVLAHRGQTVTPDGTVQGDPPATDTLGFRWTVINSVLNPSRMALVAVAERRAKRANDEEAAQRDVCQSQWAMPYQAVDPKDDPFNPARISSRLIVGLPRYACPEDAELVTVGVDVGQSELHWTAIAWRPGATPHVVDYAYQEVPPATYGEEAAILKALRELRNGRLANGWDLRGSKVYSTITFVDAGYKDSAVHAFALESGSSVFATKGYGFQQRRTGSKREAGWSIAQPGEKYAALRSADGRMLVEIDANFWKSWLHSRIATQVGQPGALTLFDPHAHIDVPQDDADRHRRKDHGSFVSHLVSERQVTRWDAEMGSVVEWKGVSRKNHYLDSTMLACVAGHAAGVRLLGAGEPKAAPAASAETAESVGEYIKTW